MPGDQTRDVRSVAICVAGLIAALGILAIRLYGNQEVFLVEDAKVTPVNLSGKAPEILHSAVDAAVDHRNPDPLPEAPRPPDLVRIDRLHGEVVQGGYGRCVQRPVRRDVFDVSMRTKPFEFLLRGVHSDQRQISMCCCLRNPWRISSWDLERALSFRRTIYLRLPSGSNV